MSLVIGEEKGRKREILLRSQLLKGGVLLKRRRNPYLKNRFVKIREVFPNCSGGKKLTIEKKKRAPLLSGELDEGRHAFQEVLSLQGGHCTVRGGHKKKLCGAPEEKGKTQPFAANYVWGEEGIGLARKNKRKKPRRTSRRRKKTKGTRRSMLFIA